MTTAPAKPKRRKWLWRTLWSMLFLLVGTVGFWCWSSYSAFSERDALIAELRSRGEHVWWEEHCNEWRRERDIDPYPSLFQKAVLAFGGDSNRNGTNDYETYVELETALKPNLPTPGVDSRIEKLLRKLAPIFSRLEIAVQSPPRIATTNHSPADPMILIPLVYDTRHLQRVLFWESYDGLAKGDEARAFRAVELRFATNDQLAVDPFVSSQLTRLSTLIEACEHLDYCLAFAAPSDEAFGRLDFRLSRWDDGFGLEKCFSSERASYLSTLESYEALSRVFQDWQRFWGTKQGEPPSLDERWVDLLASRLARPAILREQSAYIRFIEQSASIIDRASRRPSDVERIAGVFVEQSPFRIKGAEPLNRHFVRPAAMLAHLASAAHRKLVLSRLALRIRRHFDKHGRLPDPRESLCDRAMPTIRLEWFKDEPIVYKTSANGFRLELPEASVPAEDRHRLRESPLSADFGLEIEFKPLPAKSGAAK